jgi:predicted nucleotide-binding protein
VQRTSKHEAVSRLQTLASRAEEVRLKGRASLDFSVWYQDVKTALSEIFGAQSRHLREFGNIPFTLGYYHDGTPDTDFEHAFDRGIATAGSLLSAMGEEVSEYWEVPANGESTARKSIMTSRSSEIFVIHGHDHGRKEAVARLLSILGLEPIILHEQPNQGRTIIEKFEDHSSSVGFAIAIFSADDVGASAKTAENLHPRARQNVVLEFGYFMGRLGRDRVCALVENGVEIPSDYSGVLYLPMDESDHWKVLLAKELKSAGFEVDANLAF